MIYLVTSLIFIVYLALAWFAGIWLHLVAPSLWVLRGLLASIGVAGFVFYLWFERKRRSEQEGSEDAPVSGGNEIDLLFHEANTKLSSSPNSPGESPTYRYS